MKPWKSALAALICCAVSAVNVYIAINDPSKLMILNLINAIFFACLANHFMYLSSKHE